MILLLGSSGYVGSAVKQTLTNINANFMCASVRYCFDKQQFERLLINNKIHVVINCAGYTGVPNIDACELQQNKQPCIESNAFLPPQVMNICNELHIKFIHVSSGCIYNDYACEQAQMPTVIFKETDAPNFSFTTGKCSWYSGTKALGEALCKQAYICRMRIPFDGKVSERNYLCKMKNYKMLLNATNSFSQLQEFSQGIAHIALNVEAPENKRIFNMTQPGFMTTMQVVDALIKHKVTESKSFFKSLEDIGAAIKAPRSNCALDVSYALSCGVKLTPIEDAINIAIEELAYNLSIV